jgi:kynurenine formamidase
MPIMDVHQPGYAYFLHRRHRDTLTHQKATGGRSSASGVLVMMEHSGTHIDALCHQADDLRLCGGAHTDEIETVNGFALTDATEIPPLYHPTVLLDVATHMGLDELPHGKLVSAETLRGCAERQGTEISVGCVVLVRTGNGAHWNDPERYLRGGGIAGDASAWLAEQGVAAVGADNIAWDVPGYVDENWGCDLPGHLILLARSGVHIMENLALEDLAAARVHSFTLVATPLKLCGATGSPLRPIALVEE